MNKIHFLILVLNSDLQVDLVLRFIKSPPFGGFPETAARLSYQAKTGGRNWSLTAQVQSYP
jgi:hypothetical protein